jgi:hypothetical protein
MPRRSILTRLSALPLRHKILAAAISALLIAGGVAPIQQLPRKYAGSALLSFDESAGEQTTPQGKQAGTKSAKAVAESILSDDAVKTAVRQLGLFPKESQDRQVAQFRADLAFKEIDPSRLRVTWQGDLPAQTITVTNAVTDLLASWVPVDSGFEQPPHSALSSPIIGAATGEQSQRPIAENPTPVSRPRARWKTSLKEREQLQLQIEKTKKSLTALDSEQRQLQANIEQAHAERQRQIVALQPLETQLAAAKKNLEDLRLRYTDAYPDVQAAQEHVAEVETELAALPAEQALPQAHQSRVDEIAKEMSGLRMEQERLLQRFEHDQALDNDLQVQEALREPSAKAATQGQVAAAPQLASQPEGSAPKQSPGSGGAGRAPFKTPMETAKPRKNPFRILERAEVVQPDDQKQSLLSWLGIAAGALSGFLYLTLALWWFRTVQNVDALEQIVPGQVAYVGAIRRINR